VTEGCPATAGVAYQGLLTKEILLLPFLTLFFMPLAGSRLRWVRFGLVGLEVDRDLMLDEMPSEDLEICS
jgi:hypothetical protein